MARHAATVVARASAAPPSVNNSRWPSIAKLSAPVEPSSTTAGVSSATSRQYCEGAVHLTVVVTAAIRPPDDRARAVTEITRDGRPVAALLHDPSLDTDSDVVQGLAATSLMLLDNTTLVAELRKSRLRIAETGDRERQATCMTARSSD